MGTWGGCGVFGAAPEVISRPFRGRSGPKFGSTKTPLSALHFNLAANTIGPRDSDFASLPPTIFLYDMLQLVRYHHWPRGQ